tara:strand:+ start:122 stop:763 length:642 start_codon:yes stop_codon:yes gene_type:complete
MNYSSRKKNKIVKYIVIHYTGMKSLKLAYKKLSDYGSNVSAHYLISRNGTIFNLLCPKYKAWHAGKSKWKNDTNLNEYSIGIELENKGHEYGYTNYTNTQYVSLKKLISFLKINFHIKEKNIIFHSDIAPNRKKDPGEKFFIKKIEIKRYDNKKIKKIISTYKMLRIYGFHYSYIKKYKKLCIIAVKRSLNYKQINSSQSNKFKKDFYNLLFN